MTDLSNEALDALVERTDDHLKHPDSLHNTGAALLLLEELADAVCALRQKLAAAETAALERAAKAVNDRGAEEQRNFGLGRETQNFYRARDVIRALITPEGASALEAEKEAARREAVKVKPLVWEKSHIAPWYDDWHTVPTGYTIRCADENGWKWSNGQGAFGYDPTASSAKAAAQADYEVRIRAALVASEPAPGSHQPPLPSSDAQQAPAVEVHPDDLAVDRFATAMKAKLAKKRADGRGGWEGPDCSEAILSRLLREHVDKGDPLDVCNLAMMLHQRGERIAPAVEAEPVALPAETAPKDGNLLRLLVDYSGEDGGGALEDALQAWTIGFNNLRDTGDDEWQFAGWCWSHDHFTEGHGTVIGWLPFHASHPSDAESLRGEVERLRKDLQAYSEANHRQALCINLAAGALGPDYSPTIEGLPKACASVRAERDAAQARVAELEAELGRYREQYGWVMQGYEDMVEQTALKQTALKQTITALRARHATAQVNPDDLDVLTKSQTFWYSSNDEECWPGGPYDTREEAEVEAKASEHRLIVEATKTPIRVSLLFGQEEFFEQAEESLYDMTNEDGDPILDFLPEVNLDLQARVRTAIDGWQVAHRIAPVAWRFDSTGPVEIAAWAKSEGGEE